MTAHQRFKTQPLEHQLRCLNEYGRRTFWANGSEQGTGKTWIAINEMADLWSTEDLNGVLVFAPSGVHYEWIIRQIPLHMPEWVRYHAAAYSAAGKKKDRDALAALLSDSDSTKLRILAMNVESLQHASGIAVAERFALSCTKLMVLADESSTFKAPSAGRTKRLMKLRRYAKYRRIMDGTLVSQGPFDLFSQYSFLEEDLLGTTSYWSFKNEYGEMMHSKHPMIKNLMEKRAMKRVPQILERDVGGRPMYRNLDRLSALIAPHTFRVLKDDCLDLPDKVYKVVWFDLTAEQQRIYDKAKYEFRLALNGEETPFNKLAAQMKLSQITAGYYLHPDAEEPVRIEGDNPKLALLVERVAALALAGEKTIVWARFRVQIADIVAALQAQGIRVVQYHGGVNKTERLSAIEAFERGGAEVLVGQQQAGGRGLTLVAAQNVIYFSNNYSRSDREQSEDRAHRIGQTKTVIYTDLVARDTVDLECIEALRDKALVAKQIMAPMEAR